MFGAGGSRGRRYGTVGGWSGIGEKREIGKGIESCFVDDRRNEDVDYDQDVQVTEHNMIETDVKPIPKK